MMQRLSKWYEPVEILREAMDTASELLNMSGRRSLYPNGGLCVLKESANANLLDVDTAGGSHIPHRGR